MFLMNFRDFEKSKPGIYFFAIFFTNICNGCIYWSKHVLYKGPKADHHFDCEDDVATFFFEGSPSGKTT